MSNQYFFFRNYTYTQVSVTNITQLLPYIDFTQKTLIHCHGYNNTLDTPYVVDTINGTYLSNVRIRLKKFVCLICFAKMDVNC